MFMRGSLFSLSGLRPSSADLQRHWSQFSARDGGGPILRLDDGGAEESSAAGDTIPGNTGSTATLAIGGSVNGYVNTVGDDDWYRVELVAGQSYVFTLTGSGGTPLADPYLELRSSGGALIAIDDDAGPGINSLLRFTPTQSGTYYINARAFEDTGVSNTGGYTLTAAIGAAQNPLDTIDIHFQMPDNTIAIYFATTGETFEGDTASRSWTPAEISAVFAALATFSAVTPLVFTQTFNQATADWTLTIDNDIGANVLGHFFVGYPGYGAFDGDLASWSQGLIPGGSSFTTLIHEFGHGLGLAHPHDNGGFNYGVNNSEIMQGVTSSFNSYGTYQMNQSVFTVMSYNDGWPLGFLGSPTATTGNVATPMALDIALLQQIYGVNPNTNNVDNTYNLLSLTSYQAIWDTDGNDTISFNGVAAVVIDLRAATLLNEIGGAGFVSYVSGQNGGYTIANGVVIENAVGGSGNDTLVGNDANNVLDGGAGDDQMTGGLGDDTYHVGSLGDLITEAPGGGTDTVLASVSYTLGSNVENLTLTGGSNLNGTGNALNNVLTGNSGNNTLSGAAGNDTLDGGLGADQLLGGDGDDTIIYDAADVAANVQGGTGTDTLVFLSGSAPTSFNLVAQGFERAEGRLTDTGGEDWSTRTLVYDSQWRLDVETTVFDNGSRAINDHDETESFAWASEWTLYDALDRVDVIVTTFDDGTYSNNNHDQDDSFVWSSEWTRYDALDRVDTIVTTFDDATYSINEFDVAGVQPWSTQWTHYDGLDRVDTVFTTFDDGSYSINEFDVAGAQPWATQWTLYDALDRVDTVVTTYDDGSYAINDYDQANEFAWASQFWLYNSSGQVVAYQLIPDGG